MHPKVQPAQGIFLFYQLMQPGRIRDAGLSGQDRTVQRKPGLGDEILILLDIRHQQFVVQILAGLLQLIQSGQCNGCVELQAALRADVLRYGWI